MNRIYTQAIKNINQPNSRNSVLERGKETKSKLYSDQIQERADIQTQPHFGKKIQEKRWEQRNDRTFNNDRNNIRQSRYDNNDSDENDQYQQRGERKVVQLIKKNEPVKITQKPIKKLSIVKKQLYVNQETNSNNNGNRSQCGERVRVLQPEKTNKQILEKQVMVFVRNISTSVDEQYLKDLLRKVADNLIDIRKEKNTAEVLFNCQFAAEQGQQILDRKQVQGQIMKASIIDDVNKSLSHNKVVNTGKKIQIKSLNKDNFGQPSYSSSANNNNDQNNNNYSSEDDDQRNDIEQEEDTYRHENQSKMRSDRYDYNNSYNGRKQRAYH